MFDIERFHSCRKGGFGDSFHYYEQLGSTNDEATELARAGALQGTVVFAEKQTAGRGRNLNAWYSPAGLNLYYTIILYPHAARLHFLPFVAALSIAHTLQGLGISSDLKWPNDILVNDRKISGVLIQTAIEENRLLFALVGIGLNVNIKSFPSELQTIAISIAEVLGKEIERESLLASLLWEFERMYLDDMTWEDVVERVRKQSSFVEACDIEIEQQGKIIRGRTAGVDSLGGLILQTATGQEVFYAGEIQSCRKK